MEVGFFKKLIDILKKALIFKRQSVRHIHELHFFSPNLEHCLKNTTNTYTKVSKFHAKWPPKCILHPKVCEKNQRKRQKSIVYLTAIIFVLPTEGGRKLSTLLKLSAPYFTFLSRQRPLEPTKYRRSIFFVDVVQSTN